MKRIVHAICVVGLLACHISGALAAAELQKGNLQKSDPAKPATTQTGISPLTTVTYDIGGDGTIYPNKVGVLAKDRDGNLWESRKMSDAADSKIAFYPKLSDSAATSASTPRSGSRAEPLLPARGKPQAGTATEALRRSAKVLEERSGKTDVATSTEEEARRIIAEISAANLVVLSKPSGLPVFVAPREALKQNSKDISNPTSLAEKYATNGFPKAVGDRTCFKGETPLALPRISEAGSNKWVVSVVYVPSNSEPIKGTRSLKSRHLWSGYGKIDFAMAGDITTSGGFGLQIRKGTCLISDAANEDSGEIQIVDQGQIPGVILFTSKLPDGKPLEFDFGADALYSPISAETLPASSLGK